LVRVYARCQVRALERIVQYLPNVAP
jgi:hypothetical protein